MSEVTFPAAPFPARRAVEQPVAGPSDAELRAAAKAFESVYLAEMLTHMGVAREPETFGGGFGAEAFQSLLNEAYAEGIVERGGTGIAERVYRQLRQAIAP
jgi:Rod binding domain-containing protein